MSSDALASAPASWNAFTIPCTRSDAPPESSPTTTLWNGLFLSTTPGATLATLTRVRPPRTFAAGTPPATSRSAASTPFRRGSTAAPVPARSRAAPSSSPSEYVLTATIATSAGPRAAASSEASTRTVNAPSGVRTSRPRERIAARCSPRARSATG